MEIIIGRSPFANEKEDMALLISWIEIPRSLNFILLGKEYGFFKYERVLRNVQTGDVLKV